MGTRILDWNSLVRIAERRNPAERFITLAGLPAQVTPHRGTDVGFYVKTAAAGSDRLDSYWSLKREQELILLRDLVEAGQAACEDPEVPDRCAITGCPSLDVDLRGPVHTTAGELLVCRDHWTALFDVIGRADRADAAHDRHLRQVVNGAGEVVRELCEVCGGTRGEHFDDQHDLHDAHMAALHNTTT